MVYYVPHVTLAAPLAHVSPAASAALVDSAAGEAAERAGCGAGVVGDDGGM